MLGPDPSFFHLILLSAAFIFTLGLLVMGFVAFLLWFDDTDKNKTVFKAVIKIDAISKQGAEARLSDYIRLIARRYEHGSGWLGGTNPRHVHLRERRVRPRSGEGYMGIVRFQAGHNRFTRFSHVVKRFDTESVEGTAVLSLELEHFRDDKLIESVSLAGEEHPANGAALSSADSAS